MIRYNNQVLRRSALCAGVAHLVERHLAKVEVASSSLVFRSKNGTRFACRFFVFPSFLSPHPSQLFSGHSPVSGVWLSAVGGSCGGESFQRSGGKSSLFAAGNACCLFPKFAVQEHSGRTVTGCGWPARGVLKTSWSCFFCQKTGKITQKSIVNRISLCYDGAKGRGKKRVPVDNWKGASCHESELGSACERLSGG